MVTRNWNPIFLLHYFFFPNYGDDAEKRGEIPPRQIKDSEVTIDARREDETFWRREKRRMNCSMWSAIRPHVTCWKYFDRRIGRSTTARKY
jgi:hypothetical protein